MYGPPPPDHLLPPGGPALPDHLHPGDTYEPPPGSELYPGPPGQGGPPPPGPPPPSDREQDYSYLDTSDDSGRHTGPDQPSP